MPKNLSTQKVVVVSFLVDIIDVVTNLVVAVMTGSATIFSEMAQGIADSVGSAFLVIGERRAKKAPNPRHPLGHAREAFFWGLISSMVMLIVGAGLSAWRGFQQLAQPEPLESPHLAIAVIVVAIFTNGYAVRLSARKLKEDIGGWGGIFTNFSRPLVKGAFLRDVVGTSTSILGLFALLACEFFEMTAFDAIGALMSSFLMLGSSIFLIMQARALIVGQTLPEDEIAKIHQAILNDHRVEAVNQLVAIYAGVTEILIEADLDLNEQMNTTEIEILLDGLEERIRTDVPDVERVRVLLNSPQ